MGLIGCYSVKEITGICNDFLFCNKTIPTRVQPLNLFGILINGMGIRSVKKKLLENWSTCQHGDSKKIEILKSWELSIGQGHRHFRSERYQCLRIRKRKVLGSRGAIHQNCITTRMWVIADPVRGPPMITTGDSTIMEKKPWLPTVIYVGFST